MKKRKVDPKFIEAMEKKLNHGRSKGLVGWDRKWKNTCFPVIPRGPYGFLMTRLHQEVSELTIAVHEKDKKKILKEAADVANFAMMIADIHGSMDESI